MNSEESQGERRTSSQEAIIRIDMRTQFMLTEIKDMKEVLGGKADQSDLREMKEDIKSIEDKAVFKAEFGPVKAIAFGLIPLVIMVAVYILVKVVGQ